MSVGKEPWGKSCAADRRRSLPPRERLGDEGSGDDPRGHADLGRSSRPCGECLGGDSAARFVRRLRRRPPLPRLDLRPLRQPHRQGQVHARRRASTRWPPTTAPTTCTAAQTASTRRLWKAEPVEGKGYRRA